MFSIDAAAAAFCRPALSARDAMAPPTAPSTSAATARAKTEMDIVDCPDSGDEDDFAVRAWLHHGFVRLRRVGQRNFLPYLGVVAAALHAGDDGRVRGGQLLRRGIPVRES